MRIVYLVFVSNLALVNVVISARVTVNRKKKTWDAPGTPSEKAQMTPKIGESRWIEYKREGGIIGVYDADKIDHLDQMVHDAVEAQRDYSHAD